MAYNEEQQKKIALRHLFLPGPIVFVSELIVALIILILLNINNFGSTLLSNTEDNTNPVAFSQALFAEFYSQHSHHPVIQQSSLFLLWAVVGMLAYIFLFRVLQFTLNATYSFKDGVKYVQAEHTQGFVKWLNSLHDFFVRTCIVAASIFLFLLGSVLCFGIANEILKVGLVKDFPDNLLPFLYSAVWAYMAVRIIMIGSYLSIPAFRRLYNA